jgi:rare lipoprotein A
MRIGRVFSPFFLIAACSACRPAPPLYPAGSSPPAPGANEPSSPAPAPPDEPSEQLAFRERFGRAVALATQMGEASYYSDSLAGRSTASGEPYDPTKFTAAHRKLPFGSVLRVVRVDDGRSVYVKVNDRGPFGKRNRIVDLSRSAAEALGMMRAGVTQIRLEVVESSDASRLR